jgi:membrane protease subunit (stomatin/prohibitin family)
MNSSNRNRSPAMAPAFAAVLLGLFASASSAQTVSTDAQAQVQAAPAQVDAAASADAQASTDAASQKRTSNVGCVKDTGTNIRPRDPKTGKPLCIGPGRSYSREQIDRTGQTDLADALRRLDPSVR